MVTKPCYEKLNLKKLTCELEEFNRKQKMSLSKRLVKNKETQLTAPHLETTIYKIKWKQHKMQNQTTFLKRGSWTQV